MGNNFLVPFFTTIRVVAPLKNDTILSGRSIRSFRHLELKNPSIISDFRHRTRMMQEFQSSRRSSSSRSSRRNSRRSTVLLEDVIIIIILHFSHSHVLLAHSLMIITQAS